MRPIVVIGMAGMSVASNRQNLTAYFVEKMVPNRKFICISADADAYLAALP